VKAIKVKIYPRKWQKELIEKHFGCCRLIYNYGLERKVKTYSETQKSISVYQIQKDIPKMYEEKPWLKEVNSQSLQQTLKDLDSAFSHFFRKDNSFPKFKSRKNPKQSFRIPQHFEISKDYKAIKVPKLKWINFRDKFNIPKDVEFRNITISKEGNEYFAALCYDEKTTKLELKSIQENKTLGIDLGVKTLATLSDGTKIENPKHFKRYEDKLALEQQKLSKKENRESKSYQKQKEKVNKVHKKIRNTRKDFLHKLSTSLVENQNWTTFVMEDLATKNMIQNNYSPMSKAIGDAGWRMFRSMMEYKTEDKGKNFIVIGRFDPSSKLCYCGTKNEELTLNDRTWTCKNCGITHDRDELAANNIKNFGLIKARASALSKD
jgi:putative transposase